MKKIIDDNGLRNPLNWDKNEWNNNNIDKGSKIIEYLKKKRKDKNFKDNIIGLGASGGKYEIDIGFGQGLWADIPYIAIMDTAETESTQESIYVVYLMKIDGSSMYLTLNQGEKGKRNNNLKSKAKDISDIISKSAEFSKIVSNNLFVYIYR